MSSDPDETHNDDPQDDPKDDPKGTPDEIHVEIRDIALDDAPDDEDSPDYYYRRGNEYYERGAFETAIEHYTKAISMSPDTNPDLHKYYYNRGLAYACLENYQKALLDVQKTATLKPDFAEAQYILGLCYEYMHMMDVAIEQYKKALTINPDFSDAKNRLERCESNKNKPKSETLISSKPSNIDYSEVLERVSRLEREGRYGEALDAVEDVLKNDRDNFNLLLCRRILVEKVSEHDCEVVFGLEELKDAFDRLVVCPLKHAKHPLYQAPIVQSSKGITLHGPPGCGKNLFVKNAAKKAGIILIEVVLSEILSMWSGESEKRLTAVFNEAISIAKTGKPVMLFIDELDALGFARSMTPEAHEASWQRELPATFLRLFNEVEKIPNLVIVGATNCFWSVDFALKRPGRLGGAIIYVPPPDEKTRESMFRHFSKDTPGHDKIDFKRLAAHSEWDSGADINSICKDVHLTVAREIVKHKRTNTKATTEDYEWYIDRKMPQTLPWARKVSSALAKGKIEDYEIDGRLLDDLRRVRAMDIKFKGDKRKKA